MSDLSPRELEVLQLLAAGKRNTEIATTLGVKPRTISQFKARAAEKLGLDHPSDVALVDAARPLLNGKPAPTGGPPDVAEHNAAGEMLPEPLAEIAAEYPGSHARFEWIRAEQNVNARIADGETPQRLRTAAIMYRRQHAALTRQAVEALIARGEDPDIARRKAVPPAITPPEKFFDFDGMWRSRFPMPAYVEIPPEPIGDEE